LGLVVYLFLFFSTLISCVPLSFIAFSFFVFIFRWLSSVSYLAVLLFGFFFFFFFLFKTNFINITIKKLRKRVYKGYNRGYKGYNQLSSRFSKVLKVCCHPKNFCMPLEAPGFQGPTFQLSTSLLGLSPGQVILRGSIDRKMGTKYSRTDDDKGGYRGFGF